jgi:hypothetical protein
MPDATPAAPGPTAPFVQRTPWTAGAATVFGIMTVAVSLLVARLAHPLHANLGHWLGGGRGSGSADAGVLFNTMLTLMVMQAVIVACVWWGAARFTGNRGRVLALDQGFGLSAFLAGMAGMIALLAPYNLLIYSLWPSQFAADLRPFWDLARSPAAGLAAVAVVAGAPLAEELLFRGFLLPALAKTRFGFAGAAVMSSIGWTTLHFYSLAGLLEVFAIGLYFAWLVRRFGSLWLPMALHACYNGLQFAVLSVWPG